MANMTHAIESAPAISPSDQKEGWQPLRMNAECIGVLERMNTLMAKVPGQQYWVPARKKRPSVAYEGRPRKRVRHVKVNDHSKGFGAQKLAQWKQGLRKREDLLTEAELKTIPPLQKQARVYTEGESVFVFLTKVNIDLTCCSTKYFSNKKFADHMREAHGEQKPFCCPEEGCNHRTKRAHNVTTHWHTMHSLDLKYICNHCGQSATTATSIQSHLWQHTDAVQKKYEGLPHEIRHKDGEFFFTIAGGESVSSSHDR
ncbi:MAG: hypothetical protein SP1CHLAM42_04560 [Chlamydiales bacterium]|nr:hypothetical protein [Chlamydiales bacterium]